jgi:hypothetical protein
MPAKCGSLQPEKALTATRQAINVVLNYGEEIDQHIASWVQLVGVRVTFLHDVRTREAW